MKNRLKTIWAKKWVRRVVYLVVVIALIYVLFGKSKPVVYETATVTRGTVTETVAATGQIKPKSYASLRFKISGVIARTNVDVGDTVVAGQALASLDTSSLNKEVTKARANLVTAQVALENSNQDVGDTSIKNNQSLTLLYADAPQTIADIVNLTQQSYATIVSFYDTGNRLNGTIANQILTSQLILDANNGKQTADDAVIVLRAAAENFPSNATREQVDATLLKIADPLRKIKSSLTMLINAVAAIPAGSMSASTLQSYKDSLSTAQTNLNSAISKQSTTSSTLADTKVKNSLNVNSSGASYRTAQANLEKAQADFEIAQQNLSEAYLRAPFSGTIAVKSKQVGELVTTTDQAYYLIGEGGLEVTANIPEVDIAKIKVGDAASIGLDAYKNGAAFEATVSEIDPAETIVDGVATYKTTFTFAKLDEHIRSGMTANIVITTNRHQDVVVIPQRALTMTTDGVFVRTQGAEGAEPNKIPVTIGLRGNVGDVEVISGLEVGQSIIVGTQ